MDWEALAIAVMAAANTVVAIPAVRAMSPFRRQKDRGEGWIAYYDRLYWVPGNVVTIAAFGVARSFGWGLDDLGAGIYLVGTCYAQILAVTQPRYPSPG